MSIYKQVAVIVLAIFVSGLAMAGKPEDVSERRAKVVQDYAQLKEKSQRGEKIRIIATIKDAVEFAPGAKEMPPRLAMVKEKLEAKGIAPQRVFNRLGMMVYEVDGRELDELADSGLIDDVIEDKISAPHLIESIPFIRANLAQNEGFRGNQQAVAILDTGVDKSHPFLAGKVVEEACFSSTTSSSRSFCPNGQNTQIGSGAGRDCTATGTSDCSHGTHVAGIAAGVSLNYMSGVAPGASIIAVQVFSQFSGQTECGSQPTCAKSWDSDTIAALEWILEKAATRNIAAVNMSLGGGSYTSPCDLNIRAPSISALRAKGVATVISSGNDGSATSVTQPACISSAITVGSTWKTSNVISGFSNSASMVDLLAPGSAINSSVPNGAYQTMSGTSMAAPHVSGAVAVLRAINPKASVDDIETALKIYGVNIVDYRNALIFPRIDMYASSRAFYERPLAKLDSRSYSAMVNKAKAFTAYSSSDANNLPLTFNWGFGDAVGLYQTIQPTATHTYSRTGKYTLNLSAYNGRMYSNPNATATVTVYDPKIIVTLLVTSLR